MSSVIRKVLPAAGGSQSRHAPPRVWARRSDHARGGPRGGAALCRRRVRRGELHVLASLRGGSRSDHEGARPRAAPWRRHGEPRLLRAAAAHVAHCLARLHARRAAGDGIRARRRSVVACRHVSRAQHRGALLALAAGTWRSNWTASRDRPRFTSTSRRPTPCRAGSKSGPGSPGPPPWSSCSAFINSWSAAPLPGLDPVERTRLGDDQFVTLPDGGYQRFRGIFGELGGPWQISLVLPRDANGVGSLSGSDEQ